MTRLFPFLGLLSFQGLALASERAPGETVDPAVLVDITPDGLAQLEVLLAGVVPQELPIPDISEGDQAPEECIDLWFDDICWVPWRYALDVSGFAAGVELTDLSLVPDTDELVLDVTLTVWINSSADPGNLSLLAQAADVDLFGAEFAVIDIDEQCDVWLEPTPITAHTTITLAVNPAATAGDPPEVIVDVAPIQLDLDLSGLSIRNCVIGDILDFVDAVSGFLGSAFGFDLNQLLIDAITPLIDDALRGVLRPLEGQLRALFSQLQIEQDIPVLGKVLHVSLAATDLAVTPDGIRAALAGSIAGQGTPDPCVSQYGITGSKATGGAIPAVGEAPPGVPAPHVALFADDDLVNQALFAVWYEGLLCVDLADASALGDSLPIEFDTSLLGLLSGGAYDDLFPTAAPIRIATRPQRPPELRVGGEPPLHIVVEQLGLDIYAELDGRMARMVGLDVSADVGAGLTFDGDDGELAVALDVPDDAIGFAVAYNELKPDASAKIADGLSGLVGGIVGPLLGGLGDSLAFGLPSFSGLGLTDLTLAAAGPDADMIGVFAGIGEVGYVGDTDSGGEGGCGGGCDTSGCSGGCASTGGGASALWLVPMGVVLLRRRRPVG